MVHVSLQAQLPVARLSTVFPPGGRAGTTVDVTVAGADLDDLSRLLFSHTNIVAQSGPAAREQNPEPGRFQVAIGADVPVGVYEARAIGRFGVSNPRSFVVGDRRETTLSSTNHSPETAAQISPGVIVNSYPDTNAVDYFKFAANAGQPLTIECLARRIDSKMQEVLVVTDPSGRELARNRRGGCLDFRAPADGDYLLQLHDVTYRHGPEYFYRLSLGTPPIINYIFPPSGLAGTKSRFTVHGRNLPGGNVTSEPGPDGQPLEKLEVEIELPSVLANQQDSLFGLALPPASASIDAISYQLASAGGISNPVLLGIAAEQVIAEREPNNKPEQAQEITLPCELVGQFFPPGDRDWASFKARKGEVYWIEVFSHRMGLPTDPFVLVQRVTRDDQGHEKSTDELELNDSDTNIGGTGFNTATRDPVGRFEVKEDGTYRLCIRDLFSHPEGDRRRVYRVSLRKESPDFRLVALPQSPPPPNRDTREALVWTPFLRRGETIPIRVLAFRRDGFKDEIQLSVEGLPHDITSGPSRMETDKSSALIFLTASSNATGWFGPIRITGRARIGDQEATREARTAAICWNVADYNNEAVQSRLAHGMFLAISDAESTPVSIASVDAQIHEVNLNGKLQIPLKVDRQDEFRETLKLKPVGLAALDSMKELEVDGKTNTATLELDLSQTKLPAGTHTFELQTQTKGKYRNNSDDAKRTGADAKAAIEAAKAAREKLEALIAGAKQASDALAHAEKSANEATTRSASASADERPAAEVRVRETLKLKAAAAKDFSAATTAAKAAEEKKIALEKRAGELEEKVKPREVTITVYSAPITIQVKDEARK